MDFRRRHFSKWLNFTPTPLTAPVIGLIIAVVFGLSTDYEVFLVSRMVEARERGMSTAEAIRIGTATTGRIITAAATVLAVVAGSFVFSDLVMMKYLAFGLMAALLLDATVIRMFLVPSVMKLLGDDCWWAPLWMKRLQNRIGLGEIHLPDERKLPVPRSRVERPFVERRPAAAMAAPARSPRPPHDPPIPAWKGHHVRGQAVGPRPSRPRSPAVRCQHHPDARRRWRAVRTADHPLVDAPERGPSQPAAQGIPAATRPRNRIVVKRIARRLRPPRRSAAPRPRHVPTAATLPPPGSRR
ncbi:MMPL family protein [Mycobacterium xenopi 4042]|uniref:MMPL family protein n=1 Tax=Mycobacterium xenopi 4042 TaxID=1299334 RepID=X8BL06_MYCXE|nr:MMPL family protein [Mycobacterium xenopi 4042]